MELESRLFPKGLQLLTLLWKLQSNFSPIIFQNVSKSELQAWKIISFKIIYDFSAMVQKAQDAQVAIWSKVAEVDETISGTLTNQVSWKCSF